MTVTQHTSSLTLGAELECIRLRWRAERMTIAVAWLRQYISEHRSETVAPRHVRRAIADFELQLEKVNARLGELSLAEKPSTY